MTMKIACVGLTISFLFIGQTAFAQSATEAANEAVVVQTQAQNSQMSVYRPKHKPKTTPNLYRD